MLLWSYDWRKGENDDLLLEDWGFQRWKGRQSSLSHLFSLLENLRIKIQSQKVMLRLISMTSKHRKTSFMPRLSYSTLLPPHLFHFLSVSNESFLRRTSSDVWEDQMRCGDERSLTDSETGPFMTMRLLIVIFSFHENISLTLTSNYSSPLQKIVFQRLIHRKEERGRNYEKDIRQTRLLTICCMMIRMPLLISSLSSPPFHSWTPLSLSLSLF